ncbi:DUF1376 domain-containing protein [Bartonella sp. DGB1]|uniref:DUF1376 domain-containing protein n=1 Tax=Bartonella sp. DGB1 TaxID=3239807 RepID=UPI00352487CE
MSANNKTPWVRWFASDWRAGVASMTAVEKGVYISLISLMYDKQSPITKDFKRLAYDAGCTVKTFIKALDFLLEDGKIIVTSDDKLWSTRVGEELSVSIEKKAEISEKRSLAGKFGAEVKKQNQAKNNFANDLLQANDKQNQANQNQNQNNKKPNTKVFVKKAKIPPDDFNIFWEEYPHKVGKSVAIKAYSLARETVTCDVILDGLRRYKQSKPESYQWLNPSTFLNQKRWEDEPAKVINLPVTSWNNDHKRQAETVKDMDFSKVFTDFGQKEQVNATG